MNEHETGVDTPPAKNVSWYGWYWLISAMVVLAMAFGLGRSDWSVLALFPFLVLLNGWVRRPRELAASRRQVPKPLSSLLVLSLVLAAAGIVVGDAESAETWRTLAVAAPAIPCLAIANRHFRPPPPRLA